MSGNNLYKTTDSGISWTQQNQNMNYNSSTYGYNISFINENITSTFNIPPLSSNRKLEKVVDLLGRENKSQQNTPFIEIYNDGSTEKKIVIE